MFFIFCNLLFHFINNNINKYKVDVTQSLFSIKAMALPGMPIVPSLPTNVQGQSKGETKISDSSTTTESGVM